jgi:hypothetical protein
MEYYKDTIYNDMIKSNDTVIQWYTMIQWCNDTMIQWSMCPCSNGDVMIQRCNYTVILVQWFRGDNDSNDTMIKCYNDTMMQWYSYATMYPPAARTKESLYQLYSKRDYGGLGAIGTLHYWLRILHSAGRRVGMVGWLVGCQSVDRLLSRWSLIESTPIATHSFLPYSD